MGALLTIGGPLLAALVPALLHKGADGKGFFSGLLGKLKGLLGNTVNAPGSTITGVGGGLTVAAVMSVFGCTVSLSDYHTWVPALIPVLLGALMPKDKGVVTPTPSPSPLLPGPAV